MKSTIEQFTNRIVSFWQRKSRQLQQYDWRKRGAADSLRVLKCMGAAFAALTLLVIAFFMAVYLGAFGSIPSQKNLRAIQNSTASEVYSADSVLLGRYYIQDRTNIRYERISRDVIHALIATEDARFYQHRGIDSRSLGRVLVKSLLLQEESSGGGSTISQQLAKNLYPRRRYRFFSTPINKLKEMITARRLETVYSKEEILELYLNTVPLGEDVFGIEQAARRFFSTSADSLKTEEAAVLIGMLKATTSYNPRMYTERSQRRRNVVLNQMVKYNFLPQARADSLKNLPLSLRYHKKAENEGLAPYFREQLRVELAAWCASQVKEDGEPYNLYTDGLRIYTTIHSGMQAQAQQAVAQRMARLQSQFDQHWSGRNPWGRDTSVVQRALRQSGRYKQLKEAGKSEAEIQEIFRQPLPMKLFSWQGSVEKTMSPLDSIAYYQRFLNTGLVAIEPGTGFVRAWVGGINHDAFKYDHVKSRRQVGSTFKPFVYAAALERGIEPCTYFPNDQVTYEAYENWTPRNADGQYGGKYSMGGALARSVNTVSAQVIMQAGIEPTVALAQRMGIRATLPKVPALALGAANISLFEMVSAYTTFANRGYRVDPVYVTRIVDRSGRVIREHRETNAKRAISEDHAAMMVRLMQAVVEEGSAARLRSEFNLVMDIAGKTGTTQDQTDGWFIGITPDLVTGVWVGAEHPSVRFRTLALGQGSNTALPVFGEFMRRVTQAKDFAAYRASRFPALHPRLEARLACEAYIDEEMIAREGTIVERFLNGLFKVSKDKKEERKRRREERRQRRREQRGN